MNLPPEIDHTKHWLDGLPEREMYDIYRDTLGKRFAAFQVRDFDDARFDMAQTLHQHDPSRIVDQTLVDVILTRESHERLQNQLDSYASKHGLRGWVDSGESVLIVTDHGQFTDVPVVAETIGRMGFGSRHTTVQVVSEMISLMSLDIGYGPYEIIRTLSHISGVVQTVPRLDGSPSEALREYRRRKNNTGLKVLEAVRDTPGSVTVMSLVARHNTTSKNGSTLYIHEPNRRTLEGYVAPNVKVVPICIDCPTFQPDGSVVPADLQFELFDPVRVTDSRADTRAIVEKFRDATNRMVGDRYRNGIKVRSWRAQTAAQRVRSVLHPDQEATDSDY
ncbi:MAG: hypothetical protein KDB16_02780 [Acidimicrobiales bacterium]|nr:hypothetical protein [Acidimicrobiales bacterium]